MFNRIYAIHPNGIDLGYLTLKTDEQAVQFLFAHLRSNQSPDDHEETEETKASEGRNEFQEARNAQGWYVFSEEHQQWWYVCYKDDRLYRYRLQDNNTLIEEILSGDEPTPDTPRALEDSAIIQTQLTALATWHQQHHNPIQHLTPTSELSQYHVETLYTHGINLDLDALLGSCHTKQEYLNALHYVLSGDDPLHITDDAYNSAFLLRLLWSDGINIANTFSAQRNAFMGITVGTLHDYFCQFIAEEISILEGEPSSSIEFSLNIPKNQRRLLINRYQNEEIITSTTTEEKEEALEENLTSLDSTSSNITTSTHEASDYIYTFYERFVSAPLSHSIHLLDSLGAEWFNALSTNYRSWKDTLKNLLTSHDRNSIASTSRIAYDSVGGFFNLFPFEQHAEIYNHLKFSRLQRLPTVPNWQTNDAMESKCAFTLELLLHMSRDITFLELFDNTKIRNFLQIQFRELQPISSRISQMFFDFLKALVTPLPPEYTSILRMLLDQLPIDKKEAYLLKVIEKIPQPSCQKFLTDLGIDWLEESFRAPMTAYPDFFINIFPFEEASRDIYNQIEFNALASDPARIKYKFIKRMLTKPNLDANLLHDFLAKWSFEFFHSQFDSGISPYLYPNVMGNLLFSYFIPKLERSQILTECFDIEIADFLKLGFYYAENLEATAHENTIEKYTTIMALLPFDTKITTLLSLCHNPTPITDTLPITLIPFFKDQAFSLMARKIYIGFREAYLKNTPPDPNQVTSHLDTCDRLCAFISDLSIRENSLYETTVTDTPEEINLLSSLPDHPFLTSVSLFIKHSLNTYIKEKLDSHEVIEKLKGLLCCIAIWNENEALLKTTVSINTRNTPNPNETLSEETRVHLTDAEVKDATNEQLLGGLVDLLSEYNRRTPSFFPTTGRKIYDSLTHPLFYQASDEESVEEEEEKERDQNQPG